MRGGDSHFEYGVGDFLADQQVLLQQGHDNPQLARRVDGTQPAYVRVPTEKILSALRRPAAAQVFVRRYQGRGWDLFVRFTSAIRFIQEKKDDIARCGLGVSGPRRALVSEEFLEFLLSRPMLQAHERRRVLPLTTYISRQQHTSVN